MPYKSILPDIDIPECNLLSWLFPDSQNEADTPLWINANNISQRVSANDAGLLVKQLSLGLKKQHIPSGRALMVVSPNHIYVPILYLTAAASGRMYTAANPSYSVKELKHQMEMIEPAVLLLHPAALDNGLEAATEAGIPKDHIYLFSPERDPLNRANLQHWTTLLASKSDAEQWQWPTLQGEASRETTAVVNFSSGTTGLPKAVAITHHNIIANTSQLIAARFHNTSPPKPGQDRWLAFLPWFHAYAQTFSIVMTCKLRQPVYVMEQFKFEEYVRHIETHSITTLQLVPPVLVMLNKRPETQRHNLSTVSYIMSAAAPLKRDLQNAVAERLGAVIVQSWGMTETTCTGLCIPGLMNDDSGSVGYLLPNTEAILIDPDGNETQGTGELWIRGPQMMKEYIHNQEETNKTLTKDGWLKTGDITVHEDGKWWIVDRRKELIKVRGFQVAPAELEAVLLELDEVTDAAVVGIEIEGEELPRAYVVLSSENDKKAVCDTITKSVAEQVAKHKQLRGGVIPVESIPRLQSGKIKRSVVKQWAQQDQKRLKDSKL